VCDGLTDPGPVVIRAMTRERARERAKETGATSAIGTKAFSREPAQETSPTYSDPQIGMSGSLPFMNYEWECNGIEEHQCAYGPLVRLSTNARLVMTGSQSDDVAVRPHGNNLRSLPRDAALALLEALLKPRAFLLLNTRTMLCLAGYSYRI
jgi:hypothetical protein